MVAKEQINNLAIDALAARAECKTYKTAAMFGEKRTLNMYNSWHSKIKTNCYFHTILTIANSTLPISKYLIMHCHVQNLPLLAAAMGVW